jgi:hypothetical protein
MRHQVSVRAKNPAISETTDHRVRLYAIAAAAASVSALALAQPAEGEIIVTNKTIPIHANTGLSLDLNGDGVTDFDFFLSNYTISHTIVNNLFVSQPGSFNAGNSVIGTGYLASALLRGAKIGPGGPFIKTYAKYGVGIEGSALCTQNCGGKSGYSFDQRLQGKWGGGHPNRFIGVKFKINGKIHYGWIRLTVTVKHKGSGKGPTGSFSATITEYGYESVPNKSCDAGLAGAAAPEAPKRVVPKPENSLKTGPALGMLALGAVALPVWRRDELVESKQ